MTTPQATYEDIIFRVIGEAADAVSLTQFYSAVESAVEFDEDDLRPPMLRDEPVREPSWRRNVRNSLQQLKRHFRLVNIAHDLWQLPTPNPETALDPTVAWELVREAATRAMREGETFASTQEGARYRITAVEEGRVIVARLDATRPAALTRGEVEIAIGYVNAAGGRSGRRTLNYTVAKEVTLVYLHPNLMWSQDSSAIEVVLVGAIETDYPEEIKDDGRFPEGAVKKVTVNKYERSPEARAACIAHYGTRCRVCNMDFGEEYGEMGDGFIHVHHLKQMAEIGREYQIDAIVDLRPVCPNCHAMLHKTKPMMSIEELQVRLAERRANRI